MATFHHQVKSGKKGTANQHSSYIAREGSHSEREDLIAKGYGNMPAWAKTPREFWRAADKYERRNGSVYREHEIALPSELTRDQQLELAHKLVKTLAGNKPFEYAVHENYSTLAGNLNAHMHLMLSDRVPDGIERPPEQTFRRYNRDNPELGGRRKDSGGLDPLTLRDKMIEMRRKTAESLNKALATHGRPERVDHRSLKEQGVQRTPERHLGQAKVRRLSAADKTSYIEARQAGQPAAERL